MNGHPRVLMVIAFLDHPGGVQRQAMLLAQALVEMGLPVHVLTARPPGAPAEEEVRGVLIHRAPFLHGLRLGTIKFRFLNRRLRRWMRQHADQFDIIHAHQGLWPAGAAVKAGAELGKPCIIKIGNTGQRFDFAVLSRSWWGGRRMAALCRDHATRIVATSRRMEDELRRFGVPDERLVRIPNGVRVPGAGPGPDREARKALGVPEGEPLFLYVGALALHKRPMLALVSFAVAARGHPGARLWFLGGGVLEGWLRREILKLERGDQFRYCGSVEDVSPYLWAADGLVLPSVAEGMSNALLEAMAHGLACVATRISGTEDLIEDGVNGLLAPPDDTRALGAALRALLDDPPLRRRLGAAARRTVEQGYTIESVAERYLALYRELT